MSKKNIIALVHAMAGLAFTGFKGSGSNDGSYGHGIPDKPKRVIPNGCKLYKFWGIEVVATSEKRAEAKAYKIFKQRNP